MIGIGAVRLNQRNKVGLSDSIIGTRSESESSDRFLGGTKASASLRGVRPNPLSWRAGAPVHPGQTEPGHLRRGRNLGAAGGEARDGLEAVWQPVILGPTSAPGERLLGHSRPLKTERLRFGMPCKTLTEPQPSWMIGAQTLHVGSAWKAMNQDNGGRRCHG